MIHHEGISCDSCKKDNIRGKRYKCLVCYDYYCCSNCYESAATSSQHNSDHSMQCIFAKRDCELFFGTSGDTNNLRNDFAADGRHRITRNRNNQTRTLVNGLSFGDEITMDPSPSRSLRSNAPQSSPRTINVRRADKVPSPYYAGAKFSDPPPPNSLPMPPQHWITRNGDQ